MIKVTVECDGSRGTSENMDGTTLVDVIQCFEGAAKACGYCFNGHVDILEDEDIGGTDE